MLIVEGVENSIELQQGDGFPVKPETLFSLVDNPSTPTQWCEDIFAECSGNSLSFEVMAKWPIFSVAISPSILREQNRCFHCCPQSWSSL